MKFKWRRRCVSPERRSIIRFDENEMYGYYNRDVRTYKNMYSCTRIFLNVVLLCGVLGLGYLCYGYFS